MPSQPADTNYGFKGIHPSSIGGGATAGYALILDSDKVSSWGQVDSAGIAAGAIDEAHLSFAVATQAELDAHTALSTSAHGGIVASTDARLTDARTPTLHAPSHRSGGADALKIHELTVPTAATPMGGQIFTGLGAGTSAGHSLRYEQVVGVYSLLGHTHTKADIGLGNVDNTSDANKPVSTAQQTELNLKANIASPALTGTPTAPTAAEGTNTTQLATMAAVQTATASASSNRPSASCYKSAAQNAADAVYTLVSFDAEEYDTDSIHNVATNNSRLTAPSTGTYIITGKLSFGNIGGTSIQGELRKNAAGAQTGGTLVHTTAASTNIGNSFSRHAEFVKEVQLNAGDYIEMFAYQNSGAAVAITTGIGWTQLGMSFVGGTGAAWGNAAASASFAADTSHATSGSLLLVTWTAEDFDTDGMYSTASNPSRMYVNTPGTYVVDANVAFNANGTGGRYAQIRKNAAGSSAGGTLVDYTTDTDVNASFFNECRMSKTIQLNAGDYLEVFAFQNSGAALNMLGGAGRSFLSAVRVGYQTNPSGKLTYTAPTFAGTWANYDAVGTGWQGAGYAKSQDGVVSISGLVARTGTTGATVFILPAGFRPAESHIFNCLNNGGTSYRVDIDLNGAVALAADPGVAIPWMTLAGINFIAA